METLWYDRLQEDLYAAVGVEIDHIPFHFFFVFIDFTSLNSIIELCYTKLVIGRGIVLLIHLL